MANRVDIERLALDHNTEPYYVRQHMQLCGIDIDGNDRVDEFQGTKAMKSFDLDNWYGSNRIMERLNDRIIDGKLVPAEKYDEIAKAHRSKHKL